MPKWYIHFTHTKKAFRGQRGSNMPFSSSKYITANTKEEAIRKATGNKKNFVITRIERV